MRFYHVQPSELARLDEVNRHTLFLHIDRIKAREKLEHLEMLGALFAEKDDAQNYRADLAERSFPFDDEDDKLAILLEAVTR